MFVVYAENNHDYIQTCVGKYSRVEEAIECAKELDNKINAIYDDTFIWVVEEIRIWSNNYRRL